MALSDDRSGKVGMSMTAAAGECSYFTTYSGMNLPFRLVEPIAPSQIENRNTFIRAWFDEAERLVGFDKLVYGEVELAHRYTYHAEGGLAFAVIQMADEDTVVLALDRQGRPASTQSALPV